MTRGSRILCRAIVTTLLSSHILQAQHTITPPDYSKFGDDGRTFLTRCFDNGFVVSLPWLSRCAGYPPNTLPWLNQPNPRSGELLKWLEELEWAKSSDTTRRAFAKDEPSIGWAPLMRVESIAKPQDFNFSHVPARGVVLARITVEQAGVQDVRYGVGGLGDAYDKHFYLVASGFVDKDGREPVNVEKVGPSRLISGWYILGVKLDGGTRTPVRVGKSGTIRWCGHGHIVNSKEEYPAAFMKCNAQKPFFDIRRDEKFVQMLIAHAGSTNAFVSGATEMSPSWLKIVGTSYADSLAAKSVAQGPEHQRLVLLRAFLEWFDPFTDPVWMTCGVGCCIAET